MNEQIPKQDTLEVLRLRVSVLTNLVGNYQQTIKTTGTLERDAWLAMLDRAHELMNVVRKDNFKQSMIKAHDTLTLAKQASSAGGAEDDENAPKRHNYDVER